jgi:hypothetical protein
VVYVVLYESLSYFHCNTEALKGGLASIPEDSVGLLLRLQSKRTSPALLQEASFLLSSPERTFEWEVMRGNVK